MRKLKNVTDPESKRKIIGETFIRVFEKESKKFKNLTRWYEEISKRKPVQKGYDLLNQGDQIPKV